MNGVHDMGGMEGLGPLDIEPDEPVFHAPWEARVLALTLAVGAWRRWNIDASRHARERIPGPDYLAMTYYEKWLAGLTRLIEESGLADGDEARTPALRAADVPAVLARGGPASRDIAGPGRFKVGDTVRTRNLNPPGHTRLPRYVRGHVGVIERKHGVHVLPDSNAHFLGENPEHLYGVRFTAAELWGAAKGADSVHLDLWDSYLDPA
ncbi:MAG TPA: nitrile hydratase subunit beta [Caulobacteraceae bacterium]|jgi:nitrile hydratase|nr:nitrile hydratase subunit beta [Caulobacteraceae bacterium]